MNLFHPVGAWLQIHELVYAFPARLDAGVSCLQHNAVVIHEPNLPVGKGRFALILHPVRVPVVELQAGDGKASMIAEVFAVDVRVSQLHAIHVLRRCCLCPAGILNLSEDVVTWWQVLQQIGTV